MAELFVLFKPVEIHKSKADIFLQPSSGVSPIGRYFTLMNFLYSSALSYSFLIIWRMPIYKSMARPRQQECLLTLKGSLCKPSGTFYLTKGLCMHISMASKSCARMQYGDACFQDYLHILQIILRSMRPVFLCDAGSEDSYFIGFFLREYYTSEIVLVQGA
jgi:hypothetical protein